MGIKKISIFFAIVLTLALTWNQAFAVLGVPEVSTETEGATTVTYNSSFFVDSYDCNPIELTEADLDIIIDSGDAAFITFISKKKTFTPKKDVSGTFIAGDSFVFELDSMHFDADRDVYIANVHLKMKMEIDEDGLAGRETTGKFGINVHLERPGLSGNCE